MRNNKKKLFYLFNLLLAISFSIFLLSGCGGGSQETNVTVTKGTPVIKSLSASSSTVQTEAGVTITCEATDPDNDFLTYTWAATGGTLASNSGQTVSWTAPSTAGTYKITVAVLDGKGNGVQASADIIATTSTTSNKNPQITSGPTASSSTIIPGATTSLTVTASDADGDSLTYSWSASSGTISGSGIQTTFTAPSTSGSYIVSVLVTDGIWWTPLSRQKMG